MLSGPFLQLLASNQASDFFSLDRHFFRPRLLIHQPAVTHYDQFGVSFEGLHLLGELSTDSTEATHSFIKGCNSGVLLASEVFAVYAAAYTSDIRASNKASICRDWGSISALEDHLGSIATCNANASKVDTGITGTPNPKARP